MMPKKQIEESLNPVDKAFIDELERQIGKKIPRNNVHKALYGYFEEKRHITILNLEKSGITYLPESIGNLSQLKELKLDQNLLKNLPCSITMLSSLELLSIKSNLLDILPVPITGLKNLKYIYLDTNYITTLPEEIGNLSNLEILTLNHNQIRSIPNIEDWSKLRILELDFNQVNHLPSNIGNLKSMEEFTLRGNNLKLLPDSLVSLSALELLDLREITDITISSTLCNFLVELEQSGSIILGAPYPSSIKNRLYTIDDMEINTQGELIKRLNEVKEFVLKAPPRDEPKYVELHSPLDDYLNLGILGDEVTLEYVSCFLFSLNVRNTVPWDLAVEVALEYYQTGRLSEKGDWRV